MKVLRIKVSEACEKFIALLQNKAGYASSEVTAGRAPASPLSKEKGTFFTGYREYTPSDDSTLIDWKASMRAQKLLIKKFEILKMMDLIFALDVSSSMLFSSTEKSKAEYAAEVVASLAYAALNLGNKVGLVMFNDNVVGEVIPDAGVEQIQMITDQLSKVDLYGGGFSLNAVLNHLQQVVTNETQIVIVSDFIGLEKDWESHLGMMKQGMSIVGIMVRDPMDYSLGNFTADTLNIGDPFSEKKLTIHLEEAKKSYEIKAKQIAEGIKTKFRFLNAPFIPLITNKDFEDPFLQFGGI